jgi:hypothetical protein
MPFAIACPACQTSLRAAADVRGQKCLCPRCGHQFVAGSAGVQQRDEVRPAAQPGPGQPSKVGDLASLNKTMLAAEEGAPPRPVKHTCPNCHKPLESPAELAGTKRRCPFCSRRLQVPAAPGTPDLNRTMLAGTDSTPTASAWLRQLTPVHAAVGGGVLLVILLLVVALVLRGKAGDAEAAANAAELAKLRREIEQKQAELERHVRAEADARKQFEELLRANREEKRREQERRARDGDDEGARARLQQKPGQEPQQRDKDRQERDRQKGVAPDPVSLQGFPAGQTFLFRVTGRVGGTVWGTDVYTSDSELATAAVHAGVLRPGETGVVQVQTLGGRPAYAGSTRNGVTTRGYGSDEASYMVGPAP